MILISAYDENTSIINIHEELPSNTLLLSSISSSNIVQWLPSSYTFQPYFKLNPDQSLYTTDLVIDREEFCEKKFCNCSECIINLNFLQTFSMNNISIRTIQIIIEDINDHSPTFKQSNIKLYIAENVPIGYEIPLESAIDNDYGLLSIQQYELYPIKNNPFRLIQLTKPILQLNEILDREIKSNYLLKLIAYDGGHPSLSGEQNIEIIVTDVNDNAPIFEQLIYQKSLPENQPIDTMILKIHANDRDEGENAVVTYSIDDLSSTFNINHQTGEIYLRKCLDYEKQRSYSLAIKAHDNGMPQLNNYATLIIDVTDVNDHTPDVLLTEVNGTKTNNRLINLPECTLKDTPLLYIYITDEDSGENGRVSCTINDTRLNLIYLTTNAYSLQTSNSSSFDYESEQSVVVYLQCSDFGIPSLSTSILFNLLIEDCNDNPPDIIFPLPFNQSLLIPYETTKTPFILTQFIIQDRDRSQPNIFSYTYIVSPTLDISLINNGTLILCSMPTFTGQFTINVTVYDIGNLTNRISIPIHIYSMNETMLIRSFSIEKTSLLLFITFFVIIFLAAILIAICFLIAFILRSKTTTKLKKKSIQNSSCESTTSSNERAGSSQKTTIEILDERNNSSNRVYQYGIQQTADMKVINTSGIHQSDFDYSEKVERYLTHLNNRITGIDIDEGVYGSSDISTDHAQQLTTRPSSINSIHSSQQTYQDSFKRFEQLYSLVEHQHDRHQITSLDTSAYTSDSLYV
ncbi:unnamed protein product [Adineta steineri]|uniref:Cadherin domain-containing protein n=1 Tax=Adineta steineri TaxID=433720 RepID=A0A819DA09_9BILA|nr:unnamed protein product [Adineta steineri]